MSNGIFWKYDFSLDLALVFLVACRRSGGAVGTLICSYPTGCVARVGIFTYLCAFLSSRGLCTISLVLLKYFYYNLAMSIFPSE